MFTLGRGTFIIPTIGDTTVFLFVVARLGDNNAVNASIALLILVALNGICFVVGCFIAVVKSSSAAVAQSAAAFAGSSNFVGRNTYVSVFLIPLVLGT